MNEKVVWINPIGLISLLIGVLLIKSTNWGFVFFFISAFMFVANLIQDAEVDLK